MQKNFLIKADKYNVSAKLYCNDIRVPAVSEIKKAVIFGHGFGGHKDNKAAERFANRVLEKNKGIAIITFNWPCHGDDVHKNLRLEDCMSYLDHVVDYARNQLGAKELYAYATSFGGYLFLRYIAIRAGLDNFHKYNDDGNDAADKCPFLKTALRNPAVRMYDVITTSIVKGEAYDKIMSGKPEPVGFDRKVRVDREFLDELKDNDITQYDFMDYADDILILQGTLDEIVPIDSVKDFADNNLLEFIPVERADHRFTDLNTMHYAINEIIKFFGMR